LTFIPKRWVKVFGFLWDKTSSDHKTLNMKYKIKTEEGGDFSEYYEAET
jgi:hypothetical protein